MALTYESFTNQANNALRDAEINTLISKINASTSAASVAFILSEHIADERVSVAVVSKLKALNA